MSPISSAFAAAILEKHISRGGRVNIPTLGVTFPEQQVADNNLLNYLMSEEPHE